MITGVRTIELRAALWSEFNLGNAIWEMPAERMKMRKAHLVPLSTQELDLLNERNQRGAQQFSFFHFIPLAIRRSSSSRMPALSALQVSSASSNESVQTASPPHVIGLTGGGGTSVFAVRLSGKGS